MKRLVLIALILPWVCGPAIGQTISPADDAGGTLNRNARNTQLRYLNKPITEESTKPVEVIIKDEHGVTEHQSDTNWYKGPMNDQTNKNVDL